MNNPDEIASIMPTTLYIGGRGPEAELLPPLRAYIVFAVMRRLPAESILKYCVGPRPGVGLRRVSQRSAAVSHCLAQLDAGFTNNWQRFYRRRMGGVDVEISLQWSLEAGDECARVAGRCDEKGNLFGRAVHSG